MHKTLFILIFILSMLLAACIPSSGRSAPASEPTTASIEAQTKSPVEAQITKQVEAPAATQIAAPTEIPADLVDILGNLSYSGVLPDQQVTLTDGTAYYEDGGSGHPFVRLIDHLITTGDLNGDGVKDAVAFLVDYSTGSGDFVYLAPVINAMTEPKPMDTLMIGDRAPVKSLTIEGDKVIVEQIAHGSNDPACCPTWNVRKVFSLEDGQLVEQSSEPLSKVSLDDLSGTSWKLVNLNLDQEPVLPESEITLWLDDHQISGSAGCNSYTSSVTGAEDLPQTFVVGPIAATKMRCPDPVSNQENIYLDRLGKVVTWRNDFGYLVLTYKLGEGVLGELLFAPREQEMASTKQSKPDSVADLEAAYGAPSQAGFGSAIFYEQQVTADDLEKVALAKYRYFVGDLWERFGEEAWMEPWKEVYARKAGDKHDIVAELRGITDPDATLSVPMILDNIEVAEKARSALSAIYDAPKMTDLKVYNLGDGGAISGLLIAGRQGDTGDAIFLVFLLD
jgi:heat shock protein HslJ